MEKEAINKALSEFTGNQANFFDDLNAVHEAEKKLDVNPWQQYINLLPDIIEDWRSPIHATARQRCEALLKTIGKWKE